VSPQYHVVQDDIFSTVVSAEGGHLQVDTFNAESWAHLGQSGHEHYLDVADKTGTLESFPH
jgi:hypothetical protein